MSDMLERYRQESLVKIETEPGFDESFKAAFQYQYSPIISRTFEEIQFGGVEIDEQFDPLMDVEGYEGHLDTLSRAKNKAHHNYLKENIDKTRDYKQTLAESDFFSGALVAGLVDPLNIAFGLPVVGRLGMIATGQMGIKEAAKASIKGGIAVGTTSEVVRAPFDVTNTAEESAMNMLTTTAFSTALGIVPSTIRNVRGTYSQSASKLRDLATGEPVDVPNAKQIQEGKEIDSRSFNLKKTKATESIWWRLIPTPGKTIMLSDVAPQWFKEGYQRMEGNATMALERNIAGKGVQSMRQRQPVYTVRARNLIMDVIGERTKEIKGRKSRAQIAGIDLDQPEKMIGMTGRYDKWFNKTLDLYIEASNPNRREAVMANISESQRNSFEKIRLWFDDFLKSAQDAGELLNVKNIDDFLVKAKSDLEAIRMRQQEFDTGTIPRNEKVEADLVVRAEQLENQIKYYDGYKKYYAGSRSDYVFPIYYDKQLLSSNAAAKEDLTQIFTKHFQEETHYWDEKAGQWMRKPMDYDARATAEKVISNILEEHPDELAGNQRGPTKHLRHRAIDIPEWKIKDYIIKDERIFYTYAQKMGNRIEWTRNFKGDTAEDFVERMVEELTEKGVAEAEIAKLKKAFMSDYQRIMGTHIREPDRLDAQIATVIKETAGMTYLHSAGISAINDTAMLVFERGFRKTFSPLIDPDVKPVFVKAAADIEATVDGAGLAQTMVQNRYIGDSVQGIQPNRVERILNPLTNAFYNIPLLGNNLGMVTRYAKIVDGVMRQSELIRMSRDVARNTASPEDIEYLARYGIEENTAKRIASLEAVESSESGNFFYANKDKWPRATKADRDLIVTWDTAMNSGVANTVMHATSFDKPMIVDGVTYIRHYPWMENLTFGKLVADESVSTSNVKYARFESKMLSFPFQFMNFTLAATNRITAQIADPSRQHRLAGVAALFGMSYLSLSIKKPDWWFDSKDTSELMMRIADHSGVFGIYSDLFYMSLHGAIGMGAIDQDNSYLKGKYDPTSGDAMFEPAGAGPGMVRDWVLATQDMLNGESEEARKRAYYATPSLPLLKVMGLDQDVKELYMK
jgi:hypothetical protein